jgi:hypothetical protein
VFLSPDLQREDRPIIYSLLCILYRQYDTNYFRFDYLELELHPRCRYDYVSAYDGPLVNTTKELGRFCGNQTTAPPVVKSRSNVMALQFKTDSSINGRG